MKFYKKKENFVILRDYYSKSQRIKLIMKYIHMYVINLFVTY